MVVNTIQIERTIKLEMPKQSLLVISKVVQKPNFDKKHEVNLKDKVYLKTYYHNISSQVQVDETPMKVQVQELQIVG